MKIAGLRLRLIITIFSLAVSVCTLTDTAAAADWQRYQVPWQVVPRLESDKPKWVTPLETIASATLLPKNLMRVSAPVVSSKGEFLFPVGTELTVLQSVLAVACTIWLPPRKMTAADKFMKGSRHLCLVDEDRNGTFDSFFGIVKGPVDVFYHSGWMPKKRMLINQVAYSEADPATLSTPPSVHLRYGWNASISDKLIFQICLTEKRQREAGCMDPPIAISATSLPIEFEALGGKFRVMRKEDDKVQVQVLSAIQHPAMVFY